MCFQPAVGEAALHPSFISDFFSSKIPKISEEEERKAVSGGASGGSAPFRTLAGVNISDWMKRGRGALGRGR